MLRNYADDTASTADQGHLASPEEGSEAGPVRYTMSGRTILSVSPKTLPQQHDLISVLAIAQSREIDFLPITWHPGLDSLGRGATGTLNQALINVSLAFAYKRPCFHPDFDRQRQELEVLQALASEILILGNPAIRRHGNIIDLLGICWDVYADGKVWPVLILEKAPYGDLGHFMKHGPCREMCLEARLELFKDIASAVLTMHACHVVHGDLKPENLLVFQDDGRFFVKVTDFGYSTCIPVRADAQLVKMRGSRPWNAPEIDAPDVLLSFWQAKMTDLYSLGMLCLWIVCRDWLWEVSPASSEGYDPFVELRRKDVTSINKLKNDGQIRDFARRWIKLTTSGLGDRLQITLTRFLDSALSINPSMREDAMAEIESLLGSQRIFSAPVFEASPIDELLSPQFQVPISKSLLQLIWADYRVRRYLVECLKVHFAKSSTERQKSNAAFQLSTCLNIGFGVARSGELADSWLTRSGKTEDEAKRDLELMRGAKDTPFANETVALLYRNGFLQAVNHDTMSPEHLRSSEQEIERELRDIRESLGVMHPSIMELRFLLIKIAWAKGDHHSLIDLWSKVISDLRTGLKYEAENSSTLGAFCYLASALQDCGRFAEAETVYRDVLEWYKGVLGVDHMSTLTALHNMALTLEAQAKYDEVDVLNEEFTEKCENKLGCDHPYTLVSKGNLAMGLQRRGNYRAAENMLKQVVNGMTRVLGEHHINTLTALNNHALVLQCQGKFGEAESLYLSVFRGYNDTFGPVHAYTLSSVNNLSMVLLDRGKISDAEKMALKNVEDWESTLGEEHPGTLASMNVLASIFHRQGKLTAARGVQERILQYQIQKLGPQHPDAWTSRSKLASIAEDEGNYAEAEKQHREVLAHTEASFGSDHPDVLLRINMLASSLQAQGQLESAAQLTQRALETRERTLGNNHPDTLTSTSQFASILQDMGQYADSEILHTRAMNGKERLLGSTHPATLVSVDNLASLFQAQGRYVEAEELSRRALEGKTASLGPEHPETLISVSNLAYIIGCQKRYSEAEVLYVRASTGFVKVLGEDHPNTQICAANFAAFLKHSE